MTRVLSIVGAGRLGRTLGKRLREQGWRIGAVVTRSAKTSRAAVRAIGSGTAQAFPAVTNVTNGVRKGTASAVPKRSAKSGALAPEASTFSSVLSADVI